jgi:hypothetical protein
MTSEQTARQLGKASLRSIDGHIGSTRIQHCWSATGTIIMQLVLLDIQNRTLVPYLAAIHRTLKPVMRVCGWVVF